MTYVTDQTSAELRAHMRRLKAMRGWHEPLADRLFKEVLDLDAEVKALRAALASQGAVYINSRPLETGPCTICGVPYAKHGSYPDCATHTYAPAASQGAEPVADLAKELAALGWQAIECELCGSQARAFPKPAPASVEAWQPIETAPKDGTEVMLSNGEIVSQGRWCSIDPYIREQRDLEGRYIDQDESDGFDGWLDSSGGMQPDPTDWQPMPAPPAGISPAPLAGTLEGVQSDTDRIDWLEAKINDEGEIHLHDGQHPRGTGLGLRPGWVNRTLREAIDTAMPAIAQGDASGGEGVGS
jgi:hypothetical protein